MNYVDIYQKLPVFEIDEDVVERSLSLLRKEDFSQNNNNLVTKNKFLNRDERYDEIKNSILENVNLFTNEFYSFEVRMTQMWGNCSLKGMWHHRHTHKNSLISVVIFLTESDSSIWFSTPNIWNYHSICAWPILGFDVKEHLLDAITTIKTKKNFMIAFPSWLDHSVNEHNLELPRYTISCNLFPIGEFGNPDEAIYLDLK